MTTMVLMYLLAAILVKHFVCDFLLQAHPYQYLNKGTYGHPGGILHASIHGVGMFLVLVWFLPVFSVMLSAMIWLDMVTHYHIDWAKMNIGKKYNLKPDNSEWFWILLGFDQLLHMATYWVIIFLIINN